MPRPLPLLGRVASVGALSLVATAALGVSPAHAAVSYCIANGSSGSFVHVEVGDPVTLVEGSAGQVYMVHGATTTQCQTNGTTPATTSNIDSVVIDGLDDVTIDLSKQGGGRGFAKTKSGDTAGL